MNHFVFPSFYFGAKNGSPALGMATRSLFVEYRQLYIVPRHIKPGIFELITSGDQSNLRTVFTFVSCEEKGCYRIVSLGHLSFDCRSYCGLSSRMQGNFDGMFTQIDCKAGTTAEGQNLLANISTSKASLLQGQYLISKDYQGKRLNPPYRSSN